MSRKLSIKPIKELLFVNQTTSKSFPKKTRLQYIATRAQKLSTINDAFLAQLPSMFADHCCVCDYVDGILVVETHSNAISSQLRLLKTNLISQLHHKAKLTGVKDIKITIRPLKTPTAYQIPRPNSRVSKANRDMLESTAHHIEQSNEPNDINLAESLRKLAKTLHQKNQNS